jgi:diaminopimelate epimerase
MRVSLLCATDNRFAVVDAFRVPLPDRLDEKARKLCARDSLGVDGLLLLLPARGRGDCRMVLYNADGSRAEACGNGLRCVAKLAVEEGHAHGNIVAVETDAGVRRVEVTREDGRVRYARAEMGVPRVVSRGEELITTRGRVHADLIDMGNPHCVLFVDDARAAPVEQLGAELEKHARFPNRTNVEFCSFEERGLVVRIWERGVGETASCGSGASAAAVASIVSDRASSPVEVHTRGGPLRVEWDGQGVLKLGGAVERIDAERSALCRG